MKRFSDTEKAQILSQWLEDNAETCLTYGSGQAFADWALANFGGSDRTWRRVMADFQSGKVAKLASLVTPGMIAAARNARMLRTLLDPQSKVSFSLRIPTDSEMNAADVRDAYDRRTHDLIFEQDDIAPAAAQPQRDNDPSVTP